MEKIESAWLDYKKHKCYLSRNEIIFIACVLSIFCCFFITIGIFAPEKDRMLSLIVASACSASLFLLLFLDWLVFKNPGILGVLKTMNFRGYMTKAGVFSLLETKARDLLTAYFKFVDKRTEGKDPKPDIENPAEHPFVKDAYVEFQITIGLALQYDPTMFARIENGQICGDFAFPEIQKRKECRLAWSINESGVLVISLAHKKPEGVVITDL